MTFLVARRGTMRPKPSVNTGPVTPTPVSPANVAAAQPTATASTSNGTSQAVTLASAPTAGNLLVLAAYAGQAFDLTVAGMTRVAFTAGAESVTGLFVKVAGSSESATWTATPDVSGAIRCHLTEWAPGSGVAWDAANLVATQGSAYAAGFNGTVTADAPTDAPTFAVAAFGVGRAEFTRGWTDGFTWDAVVLDRLSVATKKSTGVETLSTSESWDTSRAWRGALAAFRLKFP